MRGNHPILLICFQFNAEFPFEREEEEEEEASASVHRWANVDVARLRSTWRGMVKIVSPLLMGCFAIMPLPIPGMGWIRHRGSSAPPDWRNQWRKLASTSEVVCLASSVIATDVLHTVSADDGTSREVSRFESE